MEIVDRRNVAPAMPCVPAMNASDGKAAAMGMHHANTAESALLNATTMMTLVFSQTVPAVGLAQAIFQMSL
jgi:hypothetical protein